MEIDQLSTETQTDFAAAAATATGVTASTNTGDAGSGPTWVEGDVEEFSITQFLEAGTQFSLDDILCSNYTQTQASEEPDEKC